MISGIRKRFGIVLDRTNPMELRVFAGLELFCFPASIITALAIPLLVVNRFWWGIPLPDWANIAIKILLAAATGYITNYIAVEMLFKPYHVSKRHPLSIMTFGYWSQGLIPRNKDKIGKQLGDEAETLIPPDKIADDLCRVATDLMQDEGNIAAAEAMLRNFIESKEKVIIQTCLPYLEKMAAEKLREWVTEERILAIWNDMILPKFSSEEMRRMIAGKLVGYVQAKMPDFMPTLKEETRGIIYRYLTTNGWLQALMTALKIPASLFGCRDLERTLADKIVDEGINWRIVAERISAKLGEESTHRAIEGELRNALEAITEWLRSEEGVRKVNDLRTMFQEKLSAYLSNWLRTGFPEMIGKAIRSERLWDYVRARLVPEVKPALEGWLRGSGKELVLQKLNLSERIANAVEGLSVEEFHRRVNNIAAQHLGAIQVLGYFLGAIVGVGMLVVG